MLLINPPVCKACEPPAGIAKLAGALRSHGHPCTLLDLNMEGLHSLLQHAPDENDTWSRRALRNRDTNLAALCTPQLYENFSRYKRAVADINRLVERAGKRHDVHINLANYQDDSLSPVKSEDLRTSAATFEENIFFPLFHDRLRQVIEETHPQHIGFSLNYLSQAHATFAMIGFVRHHFPELTIVAGGGLITSWLRSPRWSNPFTDLIDHLIEGPGEQGLLALVNDTGCAAHIPPDYSDLPLSHYLAPGFILPYSASSGCYWRKCAFCPETAENTPYLPSPPEQTLAHLHHLTAVHQPTLIHFLDSAIAPALLQQLAVQPPGADWYGFARINEQLTDLHFCRQLRAAGCVMLKLGLESGDQSVLDAMHKGIDLATASRVLTTLHQAGIATYVYLLFGTPHESEWEAHNTLRFIQQHHQGVTFLNLAIFNMPIGSNHYLEVERSRFYEGDLSLYTDFTHPRGWNRKKIRRFLHQEFKRSPEMNSIIKADPPFFTSNHAPFCV